MAIGERISFLRNLKNMTQKNLGQLIGFSDRTADIRIAQYESGSRTPKAKVTNDLARALHVSPAALTVPDIDTDDGFMHTLFALEDTRGFRITSFEEGLCIAIDKSKRGSYRTFSLLMDWYLEAEKYHEGRISKEDYDYWRYNYPDVGILHRDDFLDT